MVNKSVLELIAFIFTTRIRLIEAISPLYTVKIIFWGSTILDKSFVAHTTAIGNRIIDFLFVHARRHFIFSYFACHCCVSLIVYLNSPLEGIGNHGFRRQYFPVTNVFHLLDLFPTLQFISLSNLHRMKKNNIHSRSCIDEYGRLRGGTPLDGMDRFDARSTVIDQLLSMGALINSREGETTTVALCSRTGAVIKGINCSSGCS